MRRASYRRFAIVAAVFVAALGVFAGRVDAQIPAADGQFYACVRIDRDGDEGRLTRLVAADEPCRRNETRVHWGGAGVPGTPGINGTNGLNGKDGTNGLNGKDGANGLNGRDGANGINGTSGTNGTSVTIAGTLLKGDANCSKGGVSLTDGTSTYFLCNGADGRTTGTAADGPCSDNTNRYVDCGNGTVTDTVTGLIWLKDAACLAPALWDAARGAAATLASGQCNLTDGSSAGDWRLPTRDEWSATIARGVSLGCYLVVLTNDPGTNCWVQGPTSLMNMYFDPMFYWSSSSIEAFPFTAWVAFLGTGGSIGTGHKDGPPVRVWPVRSGAR